MRKQASGCLEYYQKALSRFTEHLRTPLFANAYALVITTGANAVLGVLYWIAAARSYEAEVVGRNAALIAAMMFIGGLAQLNLNAIVIRFLPTIGRQAPRSIRGSYAATLSAALCASLIFLLGLGIWGPELSELRTSVALGIWFVFSTLSWSIFHLQDSVLTGLRQAVWVPVENITFGVAKIVLLLALSNSLDTVGIFASWTIPAVFLLLPVNILIFRRLLPPT